MSATITVNFAGGTATNPGVDVVLGSCAVAPSMQNGVSVAMASALTNISVTSGQVAIATAVGAQFNGSARLTISWTQGAQPTVTLNNLKNDSGSPALVTWPTSSGPQTQILSPGDPMALAGIVNS
jgi:hypothetical protein